jgi:hypothetical protein
MAKPGDCLYPQTIPEATEEGHPPKFCSPRSNEDIGFDVLKNLEQKRDFCGIMLPIGIQSDDDPIVLSEDRLEPRPKGGALSKIKGMFQELNSMFCSHPLRLIRRSIINDKGIDLKGLHLFQDRAEGPLGIISRNQDTDLF